MRRTDLCIGDKLKIGPATLTLEKKSGQRARFAITTDHGLPIQFLPCAAENLPKQSEKPVESDLKIR